MPKKGNFKNTFSLNTIYYCQKKEKIQENIKPFNMNKSEEKTCQFDQRLHIFNNILSKITVIVFHKYKNITESV